MSKTAKWIIGIVLVLVVLQFAMPFIGQLIFPGAYAGYGMHMPMMGFGFMPFGMFLMWFIPLGTLVLIVLGIAWLVKQLTAKSS